MDRVLGARLEVGLVTEGIDGLAHLGARLFYLAADPVWVFAHWMSSFTVSTVWGTGGVAACSAFLPLMASTPATASHSTVTISAASHSGRKLSSATISTAVN